MAIIVGGPMFAPAEDKYSRSIFNKAGGHYNIHGFKDRDTVIEHLRRYFPDGQANEFNAVLFSTSGIHGTYTTLEEIEAGAAKYGWAADPGGDELWPEDFHGYDVTLLLVQPRIVAMFYGEMTIHNSEELEFLKKLRASSWEALSKIGRGR